MGYLFSEVPIVRYRPIRPSPLPRRGPWRPFNPRGGTIFERGSIPLGPDFPHRERRDGNRGGKERRG